MLIAPKVWDLALVDIKPDPWLTTGWCPKTRPYLTTETRIGCLLQSDHWPRIKKLGIKCFTNPSVSCLGCKLITIMQLPHPVTGPQCPNQNLSLLPISFVSDLFWLVTSPTPLPQKYLMWRNVTRFEIQRRSCIIIAKWKKREVL